MRLYTLVFMLVFAVYLSPAQVTSHQNNYNVSSAGDASYRGVFTANGETWNGDLRWSNGVHYLVCVAMDGLWALTFDANYDGGQMPPYYNFTGGSEPAPSSGWNVGSSPGPAPTLSMQSLPIQLASFTGGATNNGDVNLAWMTVSEVNNYGFFVERKGEAEEFAEVPDSFVPGHGTTLEPQHYAFVDRTVPGHRLYYRLRQVDLDGSTHYSDPITIDITLSVDEEIASAFSLKQNYPNPFNPSTKIGFQLSTPGYTTLIVYNIIGQPVATLVEGELSAGSHEVTFDAANFANGIYYYKLQHGTRSELRKMTLIK